MERNGILLAWMIEFENVRRGCRLLLLLLLLSGISLSDENHYTTCLHVYLVCRQCWLACLLSLSPPTVYHSILIPVYSTGYVYTYVATIIGRETSDRFITESGSE